MMKLIEKMVEKFLDDEFYAFGLIMFTFLTICLLCGLGSNAYREKLDAEVKLAKIAAGQVIECGFNCKCK